MFEKLYGTSQTFQDNIRFLSRASLRDLFRRIGRQLDLEEQLMATFEENEIRLEADVAAETALIGQVQAKLGDDGTQIAALKAEIETLQGQGVDTTRIEAALTALETNNAALASDLPAPASASTPDTTAAPSG